MPDADALTRPGLASVTSFRALSESALLSELRAYSRSFRERFCQNSGPSAELWKYDPLDHGMRRWEYPFLVERLVEHNVRLQSGTASILDAGAGLTCIPFFIAERMGNARMAACDMDERLPAVFDAVNRGVARPVNFTPADLRRLPYVDASFDVVYCISVLEHTKNLDQIVAEFYRVLRPGGRCIITFDISIDGRTDVDPASAESLLQTCADRFSGVPLDALLPLRERLVDASVLTTDYLRRHEPHLLPWHLTPRMFLGAIRRLRIPRAPFFEIGVCGLDMFRPVESARA